MLPTFLKPADAAKDPRKTRVQAALLAAILIFLAWYVFWPMFFRRTLADHAREYRDCFFGADLECLYDRAPGWERAQLNLSHAQISRIRDEFFLPKIKGAVIVGELPSTVDPLGGTGTDTCRLRLRKGREIEWNTFADLTDEGSRHTFRSVFNHAMILGYLNEKNRAFERHAIVSSLYEGLRRDMPLLQSIGMKGYSGRDPGEPPRSWEDMLADSEKLMQIVYGTKPTN